MFTDGVKLKLAAGKGGNGVVAFTREKFIPKGGPSGGNGGKGGSIIIKSSHHIYSLDHFRHIFHVSAENGAQGGSNLKTGKNGVDLILEVPCGTIVKDSHSNEILKDFTEPNDSLVICKGGVGGKGNNCFKSPTNRAPYQSTSGKMGEEIDVMLDLKLIADVGFVGFPNAGKSTLFSAMTTKPVKIGNYPFTTLVPNIGYIEFDDYSRIHLADIPGIIEDAHKDKGLGLAFLKHIERSSVLVYVIDMSATDGRSPIEDFFTLYKELKSYLIDLTHKPFLVVLNQIDRYESETLISDFYAKFPFEHKHLFQLSAKTGQGLSSFIQAMRDIAQADGKRFK
ncbi:MAG: GTPase ObgE [Chlamydiales bacterium]|nr:GTPase ObgE [Chlamydiales bacterium]